MQKISFQYPQYIWLMVLMLPLAGLWWWHFYRGRQAMAGWLRQMGAMAQRLINYNRTTVFKKVGLFLAAMALLLLSATLPQEPQEQAVVPQRGLQVMLMVDISNSMLATDLPPNRLERVRSLALKLTEMLAGNTIGLTVFAGNAWLQMPPSTEHNAIKQALQTLNPSQMPVQGTRLKPALETAIKALQSKQGQANAVVLLTDGEEPEEDVRTAADELMAQGLVVHAIGVGTADGATLSLLPNAPPLTDEAGNTVISKLDATKLKALAEATNGHYYMLEEAENNPEVLLARLLKLPQQPLPNQKLINFYPYAPWLMALAFVLLLLHLLMELKVNWPRIAGGKTVLLLFSLGWALQVAGQSDAETLKKANEAYRSGNTALAEATYKQLLAQNPDNYLARFNLANLQLKKDANREAAEMLKPILEKNEGPRQQAAAMNNAGLAAARQNELDNAITYLKKALAAQPGENTILQNLQKALLDKNARQKKEKQPPPSANPPPPAMSDASARQKLESIMEEERKIRQNIKPAHQGASATKNW